MERRAEKRKPWSKQECKVLRAQYPNVKSELLAHRMGRSVTAVYQMAIRLRIRKSADYMASPPACRLRRMNNPGLATRFEKGHVPMNKGLRRPGWFRGRMRETQFKKGERRGNALINWRPIGTILPDSDGYLRIKIREAVNGEHYGFGNVRVWPLLNRHLWAQHYGSIPPGCNVVFKDGDRGNCVIENLELVTRAEMMRRNTIHNLPPALKQVIVLKGAIRRAVTERRKKAA
jgi:hypothetical protein